MHRLICSFFIVGMFSTSSLAQMQPGSTGGAIGQQNKSISGAAAPDESRSPASATKSHRSVDVAKPRQVQSEQTPLVSGQYEVVTGGYTSTFTITVTGSTFSGSSKWTCCPGPRTDPIQGRVQNGKISFVRDCSGQGTGECRQEYAGSITEDGASGQWTGTGAVFGPTSWTMRKR
jgi:hypothetical protein